MYKGFTLIELAIVILIIGLLTAGVTSGNSLLKQSRIKATISQADEMKVKFNTFKSTYGAIPGDMTDASVFFASCAATPANCNGDGDKNITWTAGVGDEVYKAMVHMSRAELTNNSIVAMPDAHVGSILDGAVAGSISGSGIYYGGFGATLLAGATAPMFASKIGIYVGKYDGSLGYVNGAMDADDAFNLDMKIDDGNINGALFTGFDSGNFRVSNDASGSANCLNVGLTSYNVGNTSSCLIGFTVN